MAKGRVRLRDPRSPYEPQDSPLLNLPAEIRNTIYEYAVRNTEKISLRRDRIFYCPPLSLVCHQMRDEYRQIYLEEAPKYATNVNVHTTNFEHRSAAWSLMSSVAHLPETVAEVERKFTVHILLTNVWDRYRHQLRLPEKVGTRREYGVHIDWDPKTFDYQSSREDFLKLKFCFRGRKAGKWPQIDRAFEDAFERYAPKIGVSGGQRRRKRKRRHLLGTGSEVGRAKCQRITA